MRFRQIELRRRQKRKPVISAPEGHADRGAGHQESFLPGVSPPKAETAPFWKMGIIVTASALCGGIAVVLWNRRLLTSMRDTSQIAAPELGSAWDDEV